MFSGPDACRRQRAALDDACEAEGRDPSSVGYSLMTGRLVGATEDEFRDDFDMLDCTAEEVRPLLAWLAPAARSPAPAERTHTGFGVTGTALTLLGVAMMLTPFLTLVVLVAMWVLELRGRHRSARRTALVPLPFFVLTLVIAFAIWTS